MSDPITNGPSIDPVARWAEGQDWIRPEFEETAQAAVHSVFELMGSAGEPAKNFLHGTWLHEPLHAAVTDIPVGAWTATTVFDAMAALTGNEQLDFAADATLWVGLAGAVVAAASGLTDWSEIKDARPRRIGAVHALFNVAATGLFIGSCFLRRNRESRPSGRALATLGYALVFVSAHLGGSLVYEHGMGLQPPVAKAIENGPHEDASI